MCGGQVTACGSEISPSTMCVPRSNQDNSLPMGPSCWTVFTSFTIAISSVSDVSLEV